ncbi:MAG: alpha/beta fold hydrolase [Proteobacteria bacterium]|nr:alpha/beta fold hydrolase [Pseudomonadota bacterium]
MVLLATWLLAFTMAGVAPPSHAAAPDQPVRVVLVHGALIDGSSWRGVREVLVRDGFRVSIVQQPLTGLEADVAATRRVLEQDAAPVVLVGHSYGGAIISVAGADSRVRALVYVAALAPDAGESVNQLARPDPATSRDFRVTEDGFVSLDPSRFAPDFGADLPPSEAAFLAQAQMPVAAAAFDARLPVAAWHDKPSYAVIATEDRALDPELARALARRAGSKVTELRASHAVLITRAREVAQVIEAAARAIH